MHACYLKLQYGLRQSASVYTSLRSLFHHNSVGLLIVVTVQISSSFTQPVNSQPFISICGRRVKTFALISTHVCWDLPPPAEQCSQVGLEGSVDCASGLGRWIMHQGLVREFFLGHIRGSSWARQNDTQLGGLDSGLVWVSCHWAEKQINLNIASVKLALVCR